MSYRPHDTACNDEACCAAPNLPAVSVLQGGVREVIPRSSVVRADGDVRAVPSAGIVRIATRTGTVAVGLSRIVRGRSRLLRPMTAGTIR